MAVWLVFAMALVLADSVLFLVLWAIADARDLYWRELDRK